MKEGRYTWVCDPVDGTMPYSHGVPISTFSLALCEDGIPKVGVVYDPFMERLYAAQVDGGAYCNDEQIHVNDSTLKNGLIDLEGFPTARSVRTVQPEFMDKLREAGAKLVTYWGTILPSALIADGNFTAVVFNVWKPEDGAAIKVIVEEAGGKVTDLAGNEQRYDQKVNGYIASNGVVHDEIIDILKETSNEI